MAFALPSGSYGISYYMGADCTGDVLGSILTTSVSGFDCAAAAKVYGCVKDSPTTGLSQTYSCAGGSASGSGAATVSAVGAAAVAVVGALLL